MQSSKRERTFARLQLVLLGDREVGPELKGAVGLVEHDRVLRLWDRQVGHQVARWWSEGAAGLALGLWTQQDAFKTV